MAGPPPGRILSTLRDLEGREDLAPLVTFLNGPKRTDRPGFPLVESHRGSILHLVKLLVNPSEAIRKEALTLLSQCLNYEDLPSGPPPAIFDDAGCEQIEKVVFPGMVELLSAQKEVALLDSWDAVIRLLGTHVHKRTTLINAGMRVVQSAFKHTDPRMVERALRSWVVLMENFALTPEVINSSKRIKLLVMALKYNSPNQVESTFRVRLECWYELMSLLGRNLKHYSTDLVREFLIYCFGPKPSAAGDLRGGVSSPSRQPGFTTPTKPMSPVKKYTALEKVCLDALVQLFATRPLPQTLPRSVFQKQLTEVAITPQQFGEMSDIVLYALKDVTDGLKCSNRSDVLKVGLVWQGVGNLAKHLALVLPETTQPILDYLKAVNHVSKSLRRQEKLHSFLFEILETVLRLPDKIVLSHIFSQTPLEKKVSPLFLVFSVLLHENILNSKEETKALHSILETGSRKVLEQGELIEILQKMEMVAPHLTFIGIDNLSVSWQILCRGVANWEELGEVKGVHKTFSSVLHFLRFPLQYLVDREVRFWRDWGELYSAVSGQGEITVGYESGQICAEMTERIVSIFKSQENETKPSMLVSQARCILILVENIIFSGIARGIKEKHEPLAGLKRSHLTPLGPVTRTVQHLNQLCDLSLTAGDTELSELILKSYSSLFSRMDQDELMKPLLRLTLPRVTRLLADSSLSRLDSAGLLDEAFKLLESVTGLLEHRFNQSSDTQLLGELEQLFIQCFQSKRSKIKMKISDVWTVTFSGLCSEDLPTNLKQVLKRSASTAIKAQVSSDSQSGELNSFPSSSEFLERVTVTEPAIEAALKSGGTPVKSSRLISRSSPFKEDFTLKSPMKSPAVNLSPGMKPPSSRGKRGSVRLEDEDSSHFVKIQSKPKGKRTLTDHQKEVLTTRKDDIPALYSELSRDDSVIQLPSQFMTQHTFDESMNSSDALISLMAKKSAEAKAAAAKMSEGVAVEPKYVESRAAEVEKRESVESVEGLQPASLSEGSDVAITRPNGRPEGSDISVKRPRGRPKRKKSPAPEVSPNTTTERKADVFRSSVERSVDVNKTEHSSTGVTLVKTADTTVETSNGGMDNLDDTDDEGGAKCASQSLLSKAKADLKSRKNRRYEVDPSGGKRKRSSPQETAALKPLRKKTRREIAREIFGGSQDSQSDAEDARTEKTGVVVTAVKASKNGFEKKDSSSVEVLPQEKEIPSTIEISSSESPEARPMKDSVESSNKKSKCQKETSGEDQTTTLESGKDLAAAESSAYKSPLKKSPKKSSGVKTVSSKEETNTGILTEESNKVKEIKLTNGTFVTEDNTGDNTNGDDDIIGSSQDISEEDSRTPSRRSRRSIALGKNRSADEAEQPAVQTNGMDVKRNKFGETLLHQAAKKGDTDKVKELLAQGASPDIPDYAGWYPVHELAISTRTEAVKIMKMLIQAGCTVDCLKDGLTPLNEAVSGGHTQQALVLLQAGADPELLRLSEPGFSELAACNTEMMKLLSRFAKAETIESWRQMTKIFPQKGEVTKDGNIEEKEKTGVKKSVVQSGPGNGETSEDITAKDLPQVVEVIPESQDAEGCCSVLVANMDVELQSQETLMEYRCAEVGCTEVFLDRFTLSYHLRNQHSNLIQPTIKPSAAPDEGSGKKMLLAPEASVAACDEGVEDKADPDCPMIDDNVLDRSADSIKTGGTDLQADFLEVANSATSPEHQLKGLEAAASELQAVDLEASFSATTLEQQEDDTKPADHSTAPEQQVDALQAAASTNAPDQQEDSLEAADSSTTPKQHKDGLEASASSATPKEHEDGLEASGSTTATSEQQVDRPEGGCPDVAGISRLSPESNKENESLNTGGVELRRTTLQDKVEKKGLLSGNSRGAMMINLSRRKSMESKSESVTKSPALASPQISAPWAKYNPSPSHASPSASILKRKKIEDTPSSNEGSPISGKRRHVHFNEDPVSDSVEIPRTPSGGKLTRKKLKLSGFDQDLFTQREYTQDVVVDVSSVHVYQQTPPLDCRREPVEPALLGCDIPISDIIIQLVTTPTWFKLLETDLKTRGILTVGDLAALHPADIRDFKGLTPVQDVTVKTVLRNLVLKLKREGRLGSWNKKKSPVIEITTQEEEEKIKEALFNGPSPSPTSPSKNGSIFNSPRKGAHASPTKDGASSNSKDEFNTVFTSREPAASPTQSSSHGVTISPIKSGSTSNNPTNVKPIKNFSPEKSSVMISPLTEEITPLTEEVPLSDLPTHTVSGSPRFQGRAVRPVFLEDGPDFFDSLAAEEEEPLAVRAKRLSSRPLDSPLASLADNFLEKVPEDGSVKPETSKDKENTTMSTITKTKGDEVTQTNGVGVIQANGGEVTHTIEVGVTRTYGGGVTQNKESVLDISQLTLEDIMSRVDGGVLESLGTMELASILQKTVEKHKLISEFLAKVSLAMAFKSSHY